jgi:hypothetical protein
MVESGSSCLMDVGEYTKIFFSGSNIYDKRDNAAIVDTTIND